MKRFDLAATVVILAIAAGCLAVELVSRLT